jgi:hypothetical protein
MQLTNEPSDFVVVIRTIRDWLWPTIVSANRPSL